MWLLCNINNAKGFWHMRADNNDRETGTQLMPKFDAAGLLTAIAIDHRTKSILMVAYMDQQAFDKTRETKLAHFHSRSRGQLWCKGESSGNILTVERMLVDCDQDAIVLECVPAGPTCHTGATSCFYREIEGDLLVPSRKSGGDLTFT